MYPDGHSDILKADVFSGALGVAFGILNLKKLLKVFPIQKLSGIKYSN